MPQSYCALWYHVVFATKDRERLLAEPLRARMHGYLAGIVSRLGGIVQAIGGVEDHVHLLIRLPQDCAIAEAVRVLKANSSKWAHEEVPGAARFAWQNGYSAFSVSASQLKRVEEYLANQEEHHRTQSFSEELAAFLARHGISPNA
jgi:putative transposase